MTDKELMFLFLGFFGAWIGGGFILLGPQILRSIRERRKHPPA